MSQNAIVLPTSGVVSGLQMTQATNNALDTLNTLASGASAPSSPEAGQFWHDTTNNLLKIRSLDNTTWVPFLQLNEAAYSALPYFPSQITGNLNKIINGGMSIDQTNQGTTYPLSTGFTNVYSLDQWIGICQSSTATGITMQQVSDAPAGFVNSLKLTVGTGAGSVGSTDILQLFQKIEANNMDDLNYGSINAVPVSLSFWVKSSIAGTYAVTLGNSSGSSQQLVHNFTITTPGVWQKITVPNIVGPQTGTWGTGTAAALNVAFTIAVGTGFQTSTLDAWQNSFVVGSSSQTNSVLTTSGATFQVTGVMLNPGTFCLPYEKRSIQQELALCLRYLRVLQAVANQVIGWGWVTGTNAWEAFIPLAVTMRTIATLTVTAASNFQFSLTNATAITTSVSDQSSANVFSLSGTTASGLTAGQGGALRWGSTSPVGPLKLSAQM